MYTIELFTRDGCKKPFNAAKNYLNQAMKMLKADGIDVRVEEYDTSTFDGAQRYMRYRKKAEEKELTGFPLIVIDEEPFYVGASKSLPARIRRKIRGQIDSKS